MTENPEVSVLLHDTLALTKKGRFSEASLLWKKQLPDALLHDVLSSPEETPAYAVHYTTVSAAASILKTGRFRMYNTESSSDPQEGAVLDECAVLTYLRSQHKWLSVPPRAVGSSIPSAAYALCAFPSGNGSTEGSTSEDDLIRWRLYGNDGRGCSISFNVAAAGLQMHRIGYTRGDDYRQDQLPTALPVLHRLSCALGTVRPTLGVLPAEHRDAFHHVIGLAVRYFLRWFRHLVKDRHYRDEKEVRALEIVGNEERVGYDADAGLVRRFVNGPRVRDCLRSGSLITVGPTVRDPHVVKAYLIRCLGDARCPDTAVEVSTAPYRS